MYRNENPRNDTSIVSVSIFFYLSSFDVVVDPFKIPKRFFLEQRFKNDTFISNNFSSKLIEKYREKCDSIRKIR